MPGWRALDDMLREVESELQSGGPAPAQDNQTLIRQSIMHMFEPVIAVFDKLRDGHIMVPGTGYVPAPFDSAATMRATLGQMQSPALIVPLDSVTTITVRIATLRNKSYPEVITTAKWRCVYITNRAEIENKLFDNRDEMARWVLTQVLSFRRRDPVLPLPPPLPNQDRDQVPDPASSGPRPRENRVIMVDDQRE